MRVRLGCAKKFLEVVMFNRIEIAFLLLTPTELLILKLPCDK